MYKVIQRYRDGETLEIKFSNFYMARCYVEKLIFAFEVRHDRKNHVSFRPNDADLFSATIKEA